MASKNREKRIRAIAGQRQEGIVVLEDIYDPHNAAAVLRSCEAFGIQKAYFVFERQKRFNPKKIGKNTSASANKWLDLKIFQSTEACLRELKKQGYRIYATVLDKKARKVADADFKRKKIALLLGNEHSGLSEIAIRLADQKIYIPMQGFVQSLNLSVTAAICLYELARQRNAQAKKYRLSRNTSRQLAESWLKK